MLISTDYITLYTYDFQAQQINDILKYYCNKNDIIIDANAGMGGNSFYFCKYFNFVYCIDNNEDALSYLEHNLREFDNKFLIYENCLDILKIINYNVIFFDPPWGGPKYKYKPTIDLFLNEININDIIENLYNNNSLKLIALKAPFNFNINFDTKWKIRVHNILKNKKNEISNFCNFSYFNVLNNISNKYLVEDRKNIIFKLIIYSK